MDLNIFSALLGQVTNQPSSLFMLLALSIVAYLVEILPFINSRYIPHYTVIIGMIFYPFFTDRGSVPYYFPNPIMVQVANGMIAGFVATLIHTQIIRRLMERFGAQVPAQPTDSASAVPEIQPSPTDSVPPALSVVFVCGVLAFVVTGCGSVKYAEGADPIVVQAEAWEQRSQNAFDLVLHADNANRDYFRTNAPGFHGACEWLRTPISYHGTTTLARAQCVVLQLDDVKQDYKAGRADSNQLATATVVLESIFNQVQVWIPTIVGTNSIK